MARRVKWYTVTSPRSQSVVLANGTAKQMPRGAKFQAAEKNVVHLLRTRVIRELHPREVPPPPSPKKHEVKQEDMLVIVDGSDEN